MTVHEDEVEEAVAIEIGKLGVGASVEEGGKLCAGVAEQPSPIIEQELVLFGRRTGHGDVQVAIVVYIAEIDAGGGIGHAVECGGGEYGILEIDPGGTALHASLIEQQADGLGGTATTVVAAIGQEDVEVAVTVDVADGWDGMGFQGQWQGGAADCSTEVAQAIVVEDDRGHGDIVDVEAAADEQVLVPVLVEVGSKDRESHLIVNRSDAKGGFVDECTI